MALTLIPIGSGKREKSWKIRDVKVICRYNYFYILADDCQALSNIKWYISDTNGEKEIPYEHLKQIFKNQTPRLGVWERYALIILATIIGAVIIFNGGGLVLVGIIVFYAALYYGGNYVVKKFKRVLHKK